MTSRSWTGAALVLTLAATAGARADTHFVDAANATPVPPYTTPGTAATSIGDALVEASSGDTVSVASGTYAETVALLAGAGLGLHDDLTLMGTGPALPDVTGGMTLGDGLSGPTVTSFRFTGAGASDSIVRLLGVVTDLEITDCVFDGELVAGRRGIAGGSMEGDVTVERCEFLDIRAWPVLDSRSGSGGDGSPMNVVNFNENFVHDCNGTVTFRGFGDIDNGGTRPAHTPEVNIHDNIWERIGGAGGDVGDHWAAFEVNRAIDVNLTCNSVDGVALGSFGEGAVFQAWSCADLQVDDNRFAHCDQGIWLARVDAGPIGNTIAVLRGNTFFENAFAMRVDPTISEVDAEDNWWGDGAGPLDTTGISEAGNPGCFPPATMKNDNGLANAEIFSSPAGTDNVDYCPWLTAQGALSVEVDDVCQGDAGDVLYVEVWMRDVAPFAQGWYAEIDYDVTKLAFNDTLSTYTVDPFPAHITTMAGAEAPAGELQLDGSTFDAPPAPPAKGDALLATLCFDILTDCETTEVVFDDDPLFISELSFEGLGLATALVDTPVVTFDDTPPVVTNCPGDVSVDGPPCDQVVAWIPPDVSDNCDPAPIVTYDVDFDDDGTIDETVDLPFTVFPVGTHKVVVIVTDACGNVNAVCKFQVINTGTCPEDCAEPCDDVVNVLDLLVLLSEWGMPGPLCDITDNGTVDVVDLLDLLAAWGPCP